MHHAQQATWCAAEGLLPGTVVDLQRASTVTAEALERLARDACLGVRPRSSSGKSRLARHDAPRESPSSERNSCSITGLLSFFQAVTCFQLTGHLVKAVCRRPRRFQKPCRQARLEAVCVNFQPKPVARGQTESLLLLVLVNHLLQQGPC